MANTVRLVDGSTEVVLRPAIPTGGDAIFLQEFDMGFPEAREVKQDIAGADGSLDLTTRFGARTITARLKITGNSATPRNQVVDTLRSLSAPGRRPYLYVERESWAGERRALLRPNPFSCLITTGNAFFFDAALSWQVPGGLFEATDSLEFPLYPPTVGTGGTSFPPADLGTLATAPAVGSRGLAFTPADLGTAATAPHLGYAGLSFAPGSSNNVTAVPNPGSATVEPELLIMGRCVNPVITNVTAGWQLAFGAFDIPAGHWAQVDVARKGVFMDSDPNLPMESRINWAVSSWPLIVPGDNVLTFTASNVDNACYLVVRFRPRWF